MVTTMKKGLALFAAFVLVFGFVGCSNKDGDNQGDIEPNTTAQATEAPTLEPTEKPEDFSLTTTLPDGRSRIEARVISLLDDKTLKVKTQNGEEEINLSDKVSENAKILGVKEQSKIIVTMKDGVADTIELVTGE